MSTTDAGIGVGVVAPTPPPPATPSRSDGGFVPLVTVVGFHHARGPEVETWFGVPEGTDPAVEYDWSLLPFMALSDGAHASSEDFSYFTLLRPASEKTGLPATSLFGISCTRQLDASQLLNRPADVTRSTVQKAVVVVADSPRSFGVLRERLSVVTQAWFAQREFTDVEILRRFQESLADEKARGLLDPSSGGGGVADRDTYLGMSLREFVREFKWQTLVLLKCCLLQPKMLFFSSRCERLCMLQFCLISLIPGLIRNLQDCADPELNNYEKNLTRPTTLQSSNRASLLTYMGLPLQIFGKGSLFGPYTPLQQLDVLADFGTKSYIVGSTNSLLLQQRDRYSDILINLDDDSINITSSSLRAALTLSVSDRRWIDYLTQEVNDTWDEKNPSRPKTMGYVGSEEFIRLQFEEYILSLISSVKYRNQVAAHPNNPLIILPHIEGDPSADFGAEWVEAWLRTDNYRLWNANTDPDLFNIVEPKHPCAGGLTIDDVQRRIAQQVQELHLDERLAQGREVLGRNLAAGKEKASGIINKLYSDMEALRESQRRRAEETRERQGPARSAGPSSTSPDRSGGSGSGSGSPGGAFPNVDLTKAQETMQSVGMKAGAYMSSWATWAGEKRKTAAAGGGWGFGGGGFGGKSKAKADQNGLSGGRSSEKEYYQAVGGGGGGGPGSRLSGSSAATDDIGGGAAARPLTQGSVAGSIFSAGSGSSAPASPRPLSGGSATGPSGRIDGVVKGEKLAFYRDEEPVTEAKAEEKTEQAATVAAVGGQATEAASKP